MPKPKPKPKPHDEVLSFGGKTLERLLSAESNVASRKLARTAARLIEARQKSKAAKVLVKLARELEQSVTVNGYLLSAVLNLVACCKYATGDSGAAKEYQDASSGLYRRVTRSRAALKTTLGSSNDRRGSTFPRRVKRK